MILNSTDIKDQNLISQGFEPKSLKEGSYNIRIGSINIGKKDFIYTSWEIPVNGLIVVISKEEITLPPDIIGYAHIKTSFSQEGLLAINTGIIDPNYKGYLSTVLINYSSQPRRIEVDEEVLRLTFHRINPNSTPLPYSGRRYNNHNDYCSDIFRNSSNLSNTFVNEEKIIKDSKKQAMESIWQLIVAVGVVVTTLMAIFGYMQNMRLNKYQVESLEYKINKQNEIISDQNKKIDSLLNKSNQSTNASRKGK